ncbi:hypothetical protein JXB02_05035 [Candidatus Woesearchaeota archaeon]|nr:hypothetical protein [Candidatus Woesearchaeota archaeon]
MGKEDYLRSMRALNDIRRIIRNSLYDFSDKAAPGPGEPLQLGILGASGDIAKQLVPTLVDSGLDLDSRLASVHLWSREESLPRLDARRKELESSLGDRYGGDIIVSGGDDALAKVRDETNLLLVLLTSDPASEYTKKRLSQTPIGNIDRRELGLLNKSLVAEKAQRFKGYRGSVGIFSNHTGLLSYVWAAESGMHPQRVFGIDHIDTKRLRGLVLGKLNIVDKRQRAAYEERFRELLFAIGSHDENVIPTLQPLQGVLPETAYSSLISQQGPITTLLRNYARTIMEIEKKTLTESVYAIRDVVQAYVNGRQPVGIATFHDGVFATYPTVFIRGIPFDIDQLDERWQFERLNDIEKAGYRHAVKTLDAMVAEAGYRGRVRGSAVQGLSREQVLAWRKQYSETPKETFLSLLDDITEAGASAEKDLHAYVDRRLDERLAGLEAKVRRIEEEQDSQRKAIKEIKYQMVNIVQTLKTHKADDDARIGLIESELKVLRSDVPRVQATVEKEIKREFIYPNQRQTSSSSTERYAAVLNELGKSFLIAVSTTQSAKQRNEDNFYLIDGLTSDRVTRLSHERSVFGVNFVRDIDRAFVLLGTKQGVQLLDIDELTFIDKLIPKEKDAGDPNESRFYAMGFQGQYLVCANAATGLFIKQHVLSRSADQDYIRVEGAAYDVTSDGSFGVLDNRVVRINPYANRPTTDLVSDDSAITALKKVDEERIVYGTNGGSVVFCGPSTYTKGWMRKDKSIPLGSPIRSIAHLYRKGKPEIVIAKDVYDNISVIIDHDLKGVIEPDPEHYRNGGAKGKGKIHLISMSGIPHAIIPYGRTLGLYRIDDVGSSPCWTCIHSYGMFEHTIFGVDVMGR